MQTRSRAALVKVAWLSVFLGIGMEILLLMAAASFGAFPAAKAVVADLAQKISWSFIVCAGLALGTAAAGNNKIPAMGLSGLISAPLAFNAAKALHKGVSQALSIAGPASGAPSPFILAAIKSVEYGLLGCAAGWLAKQSWAGARAHAGTGLALGVLFGGIVMFLTIHGSPKPPAAVSLLSKGLNEILFPVGCSLVLFSATALSRQRE